MFVSEWQAEGFKPADPMFREVECAYQQQWK
jgi:hypothetical protein